MATRSIAIKETSDLTERDIDRIIEMAWEDRTPFDAIEYQFSLTEDKVKELMKRELKFSSYRLWRKRVESCKTKHAKKRSDAIDRFKCSRQRAISSNKIAKR
ncbi:TIGR03643 family protein [Flavobacterium arcticum]|uniref:TIGR03643 family protein n=1 Tax=Flavobacterium arcticum TaxID=1784713 RepID=A0A345HBK9_9FLAO|nr:TIGR03643 family protein [Flavobacterium arcticum]AXG73969.1 TIGR03643 family protein [Flavobacterium arcticum]KAF2508945.1 TIGR03643 family protein [Flavobacterium arcticum]